MLSGRHALVTDFGVAKAVSEATGRDKLTTVGVALGTPTYMAPEQAAADPHIDHRADIYAVGAVAYELLTGRPPFLGTTPQMILSAHLADTPEPVTKYREAVPPALEQLVLKCLEKNPADRWQSAEEMLPHLEALATPSGGITPTGTMPVGPGARGRKLAWVLSAVLGLVTVASVAVLLVTGRGSRLVENRVFVAVFDNETGDPSLDHVGKILADWLARGLQETGLVEVVDPSMALNDEATADGAGSRPSNRFLAERVGAGTIVSGAYYLRGDSLQIQANLVETGTGNLISTLEPVLAPTSDPLETGQSLADRVMGSVVAVVNPGGLEPSVIRAPLSYSAYKEYLTGIEVFYGVSQAEALPHFERACALDSTFVAPLVWIIAIHTDAGRWAQGDSIVQLMKGSRDRLMEIERHALDWLDGWIRGDMGRVYRAVKAGAALSPDHRQFNLLHGRYALLTNRLEEAVEVFSSGNVVDPWQNLTAALHLLGEYDRELDEARSERVAEPDSRSGLDDELRALIGLGRIDEVRNTINEIMNFPSGSPGASLRAAALELRAHGYQDDAKEMGSRAIAWYRDEASMDPTNLDAHYELGWSLYEAGMWEEAREVFTALANSDSEKVDYLGSLGVVEARAGLGEEASRIDETLATLDRPYLMGSNTQWRARIAAVLGERERAVALLRDAYREGVGYDLWLHTDVTLDSLRGFDRFEEFLTPRD